MTFATTTLNNSSAQIAAIEAQIVSLQQQLTELQENQQKIKSAEQQGLSAIAQYKAAISAIAALGEPDMLKEFLREMATITAESVDCYRQRRTLIPKWNPMCHMMLTAILPALKT